MKQDDVQSEGAVLMRSMQHKPVTAPGEVASSAAGVHLVIASAPSYHSIAAKVVHGLQGARQGGARAALVALVLRQHAARQIFLQEWADLEKHALVNLPKAKPFFAHSAEIREEMLDNSEHEERHPPKVLQGSQGDLLLQIRLCHLNVVT